MRLAIAVALAALLLAAPAGASERIGRCKVADSARVEARNAQLLVWSVRHRDRDDDFFTNYFACRRSSGARVPLTTTLQLLDYDEELSRVSVAGVHVAYARFSSGRGSAARVVVHDATRGTERSARVGFDPSSGAYGHAEIVPALVVARTGGVAYVVHHPFDRDRSGAPREPVGLRAFDTDGGRRLLDKGGGIDPASLRLDGGTVHWTNAGEPRSAPLR